MTKSPVRLTILVPTYHRPALLRRAVESVQAQQFADYILRIHDNGTDAETLALAQELMATDPRIEYRRNSVNLGAEGNISQLIASVDTPYFCFLCDDDVILPGFLAAAMDGFATHPDIGFSAARTVLVHLQGSYIRCETVTGGRAGMHPALWPCARWRRRTSHRRPCYITTACASG
jgi:glycosyltransferase involved in cell wall biosynthesis